MSLTDGTIDLPHRGVFKRPHRKARTGCRTCKERRVKCNEAKPACGNCIKHSVHCDFLTTPHTSASPSPSAHPPQATMDVAPSLCMEDLELMHNFSTSTSFTLSHDPVLRTLWRINVPQLAFCHDYVMHGILAVSALHLARANPGRANAYIQRASSHYDIGLRRASKGMLSFTKENCSALYAFSVLTVIFALASPRKAEDFLLFGELGTPEWMLMIRGNRSILEADVNTELRAGPISALFSSGARRMALQHSVVQKIDHLAELRHLITTTLTDWQTVQVYATSIDILNESYKIIYRDSSCTAELSDVFSWPFRVTDEYLLLLRQRTQEALCILAYFCVLLKALDSYWWTSGWAVHTLTKIHELLDEEHRLWIRWPIEELGGVLYQGGA